MANLSHLLGKKTGDVEKPKPFPIGHYLWNITAYGIVESSKKKTPGIEFQVKMVEPMDDVDEDDLGLVKNPHERQKRLTFWLTEDSLWRLKDFLIALGVNDDDKTLEELLPETVGEQFIAGIVHETIEGQEDPIDKLNDNSVSAPE